MVTMMVIQLVHVAVLCMVGVKAESLRPNPSDASKSAPAPMKSLLDDLFREFLPSDNPLCPRVVPVSNFNLDRYIEKSWYVQMQQVTPYQAENQLYCVTATYERDAEEPYIRVANYANNDAVNGPVQSSEDGGIFGRLCAKQNEAGTGNLNVGPCFLRVLRAFDVTTGPYWVIGLDRENYEWAIVIGGQPTEIKNPIPVQCTTRTDRTNGSGLWLLTRDRTGLKVDLYKQMMLLMLNTLGVSTSELKPVNHTGCLYQGATIK